MIVLLLMSLSFLQAQIGINTTDPDSSAILHMKSTSQGILIPRMTTQQRDAILSQAQSSFAFAASIFAVAALRFAA